PTGPGWARFDVRPPDAGLDDAMGRVPTPRGAITLEWHRAATAGGPFTLDLTVPANALAEVTLPAAARTSVTEGGHRLGRVAGVLLGLTSLAGVELLRRRSRRRA